MVGIEELVHDSEVVESMVQVAVRRPSVVGVGRVGVAINESDDGEPLLVVGHRAVL